MKMLPKTAFTEGAENTPHEPINEIHVHKLTMQQLFVPVSESRHFTRDDAAKAFHEKMLSADKRSPQPELIQVEREVHQSNGTVSRDDRLEVWKEEMQKQEAEIAEKLAKKDAEEAKKTTRVKTDRFEFRFKEVSADDVGVDGKSRDGTGWRYGVPHEDRKRGQVKIPTSVP
jgi:DNA-binding GntR family transcriptional regulator